MKLSTAIKKGKAHAIEKGGKYYLKQGEKALPLTEKQFNTLKNKENAKI